MPITSKTGLLPTLRKKNNTDCQETVPLEFPKIVAPAPYILKPFAGIYNPFPYGCSILCNHPADFEAKTVVKRAKDAWSSEGKSLIDLEQSLSILKVQDKTEQEHQSLSPNTEKDANVPEELFRKYTETDSRPITPAPTLTSVVTKNLKSRRCMTPDPATFIPTREKTLLVLDLRRSHSQETVFWPGSQTADFNFESNLPHEPISSATSHLSTNQQQLKKKKTEKRKVSPSSAKISSLKTQSSKDSESKVKEKPVQLQHSASIQSPSRGSLITEQEISQIHEASSESSLDEANLVKRRGKKTKKGKKTRKDGAGGEKEFQGIPDPGETQVSALENDSESSTRPSSSEEEEEKFLKDHANEPSTNREPKPELEEKNLSFLNQDTLKRLQRQLDQEEVDAELNAKRKIALEEALRLKKTPKHANYGEEMKTLKKEYQLVIKDSEKWLSIPRIFTRQSARFELPMDSRMLNSMTPTQYAENYVFASPERLVLYNHVFNLFKEDPEDDEERDRILLGKNVTHALGKVMGRPMTSAEGKEFQHLLKWKENDCINFRTFAGISAICERVLSPRFCSKILTQTEDPRHEIERADFESLDEKLQRLNVDYNLVTMLKSIRDV